MSQVCVTRGSFSAAAAQGSASSGKQSRTWPRRARAAPHLALPPFRAPDPAGTAPSSPTERKFSLQPGLLTQCWAEASATPEGLLLLHRGDSDLRPDFKAPRSIQQAPVPAGAKVSRLIQGEHPGFHTSCKGNIPVSACRGRAPPQVCFHGLPFPR